MEVVLQAVEVAGALPLAHGQVVEQIVAAGFGTGGRHLGLSENPLEPTISLWELINQILRVGLGRIVCESAGACNKRQDAIINAIAKGVLATVDVDIMNAAGIVAQESLNVVDRHPIDEHQRRPRTIVGKLLAVDKQVRYTIRFLVRDAFHIFNQHLPDREELTVLIKIIGQIRLCAKHGIVIV